MEPSISLPHSQEPTTHFLEIPAIYPPKPCMYLFSPHMQPCPTYLIHVDLITRRTYGEEYRSWSATLIKLVYSPVTLFLLGPTLFLSILFFFKHPQPMFSLNEKYHTRISCPCKTTGKIAVLYILNFIFVVRKLEDRILCWMIASIPCVVQSGLISSWMQSKDGRPSGNMVKSQSTQCDLVSSCVGSHSSWNSLPFGGGLQGTDNIMVTVLDVVQCVR
jgi:hypothetical protein